MCWFDTVKRCVVDYSGKTKRILIGVGIVHKETKEKR
jgi:hypothetical protein